MGLRRFFEAMLLEGPRTGQKTKTKVSSFTEEKKAASAARHGYGVSSNQSTFEQKMQAALHFLKEHCKAVMRTRMPS